MEARFHSDSSNNDWGYKFTVSFFAKTQHSISSFFKVITPAMSSFPLMFAVQHDIPLLDHSLCKIFALYLKTLASLPDFNVDGVFRNGQHGSVINHLKVLLLMQSLGHSDQASIHCLFKKIYLLACISTKELLLPPCAADQDIISEIGSVFAEHLMDPTLRAMIDKAFVDCAAISASFSPSSVVFFSVLASAIDCRAAASSPEAAGSKVVGSCSNQHPMTLCTSIPLTMMNSSRGWMCSVCNKQIPLFQTGVWYCETCSYVSLTSDLHHFSSPFSVCSFTVCTACQSRYISVRARENFQVGQVVQLIPAEMGNYRDFSDAAGGPLVLGQMEPIEQVSDNRIRSVHTLDSMRQINRVPKP
jgi:hypothetical protein